MAQQARPNVAGHSDPFRTQPAASSTVVSSSPEGTFSSIPMFTLLFKPARAHAGTRARAVPPFESVPVQTSTAPLVDEGHADQHQEAQHREETENAQLIKVHRPRVQEDDLDVEDDERHRRQVVLDRETPTVCRTRGGLNTALIGVQPGAVVPLGADAFGEDRKQEDERDRKSGG